VRAHADADSWHAGSECNTRGAIYHVKKLDYYEELNGASALIKALIIKK
jgi:hypothetical protein